MLGGWDLRDRLLNPVQCSLGVTGERIRPRRNTEQIPDGTQCCRCSSQGAANQHRRDIGPLLHLVGERHIGGRGAADIEH